MKPVKQGPCFAQSERCVGGDFCMHDCYQNLAPAAMRAMAEYGGFDPIDTSRWYTRLSRLINNRLHPTTLSDCGVTPELLAFCQITIDHLVLPRTNDLHSHYYLEDLINGLSLTFADLLLLGFRISRLALKTHFPLIVLYDLCGMSAADVFSFHISFSDLQHFLIDTDARYPVLLSMNVEYCRSALE